VNYQQPNSQAVLLNRVVSATPSQIDGAIKANGRIIIANTNGVTFGKGADVQAAAVVATTMNQTDQEFMEGSNTFSGSATGKVVNKGKLQVNDASGYVALLAPEVRNQGVISATVSNQNAVVLGAGEKVTLQFTGTQLIGVTIDKAALNAAIKNRHAIEVAGGTIVMAAGTANQFIRSVVKNTGTLSASSMVSNGGTIELVADTVVNKGAIAANAEGASGQGGKVHLTANTIQLDSASDIQANSATQGNGGAISVVSQVQTTVAGKLSATGGSVSGNGGTIETSSKGKVSFASNLVVNTSAPRGSFGQWIVDPQELTIDANAARLISQALNTTHVTLNATADSCVGAFGACTPSASPVVNFLAGADIMSTNSATSLRVIATGGVANLNSTIDAGQVYIEAATINVGGNINTTGGANGKLVLLGLGSICWAIWAPTGRVVGMETVQATEVVPPARPAPHPSVRTAVGMDSARG
jgi:filamentous hemagglutinin family protein